MAILQLRGAAFGAYMLAHKSALRFKWTGAISSAIVGVLSGLVVVILAAIFPAKIGGSYAYYSASASLSGASFRTFFMAFLLAGLGALAGYALAQFAPDSNNVFSATWRWAHRTRGFVRTLVESAAICGVLFLALGLVALIVATAASGSALAGILLIPLLLPAVPFVLFSVSSFGGVTASVSGQSSYTLSLFNVASVTQYAWALWICFVLFIIATIYIALRETARNMYDPYYAKWENTWKAPVAVMVFWLVAEFLCTNFLAGYSSNTVSTMVPMWYFIVAGVWSDVGCVDAGIVEDSCWRYRTADSAERRRLRQGLRSAFRPTEGSQDRSFRADHADRAIQRAVRQSVRASNVTSRADHSYASDARCSNANHANPSASRFGSTSTAVNGFGSSHATISGRHSDAGRSTG